MAETLKQTFQDDIQENTDLAQDYMEQINRSFFLMLKNPTEKEIEKQRKINDALIATWLALHFKNIEEQLYRAAQRGIDEADKQLKAKDKKEVKDKKINIDTYESQLKQRQQSHETDLILVTDSIKSNYERSVSELKNNPVSPDFEQQKKISTELATELIEKGITFFYDRAGRRYSIAEYINMKTMTDVISAERLSFFTRAIQYGVDLVRIIHLNLHPQCPLCIPFENKILSITGRTKGYMTIDEAALLGLFHPRCDHVPEAFELEPEDNGKDSKIELNEANKKRYEYNKKRGFRWF